MAQGKSKAPKKSSPSPSSPSPSSPSPSSPSPSSPSPSSPSPSGGDSPTGGSGDGLSPAQYSGTVNPLHAAQLAGYSTGGEDHTGTQDSGGYDPSTGYTGDVNLQGIYLYGVTQDDSQQAHLAAQKLMDQRMEEMRTRQEEGLGEFRTDTSGKYGEGRYGDIYRDSTTVPIDQVINPQTHLPFEQGGRSEEYGEYSNIYTGAGEPEWVTSLKGQRGIPSDPTGAQYQEDLSLTGMERVGKPDRDNVFGIGDSTYKTEAQQDFSDFTSSTMQGLGFDFGTPTEKTNEYRDFWGTTPSSTPSQPQDSASIEADIQISLAKLHINNTNTKISNLQMQITDLKNEQENERQNLINQKGTDFASYNESVLRGTSSKYLSITDRIAKLERELEGHEAYKEAETLKLQKWEGQDLTSLTGDAFTGGIKFENPMALRHTDKLQPAKTDTLEYVEGATDIRDIIQGKREVKDGTGIGMDIWSSLAKMTMPFSYAEAMEEDMADPPDIGGEDLTPVALSRPIEEVTSADLSSLEDQTLEDMLTIPDPTKDDLLGDVPFSVESEYANLKLLEDGALDESDIAALTAKGKDHSIYQKDWRRDLNPNFDPEKSVSDTNQKYADSWTLFTPTTDHEQFEDTGEPIWVRTDNTWDGSATDGTEFADMTPKEKAEFGVKINLMMEKDARIKMVKTEYGYAKLVQKAAESDSETPSLADFQQLARETGRDTQEVVTGYNTWIEGKGVGAEYVYSPKTYDYSGNIRAVIMAEVAKSGGLIVDRLDDYGKPVYGEYWRTILGERGIPIGSVPISTEHQGALTTPMEDQRGIVYRFDESGIETSQYQIGEAGIGDSVTQLQKKDYSDVDPNTGFRNIFHPETGEIGRPILVDSPEDQSIRDEAKAIQELAIQRLENKFYNEMQAERSDVMKFGKYSMAEWIEATEKAGVGDSALTVQYLKERGLSVDAPVGSYSLTGGRILPSEKIEERLYDTYINEGMSPAQAKQIIGSDWDTRTHMVTKRLKAEYLGKDPITEEEKKYYGHIPTIQGIGGDYTDVDLSMVADHLKETVYSKESPYIRDRMLFETDDTQFSHLDKEDAWRRGEELQSVKGRDAYDDPVFRDAHTAGIYNVEQSDHFTQTGGIYKQQKREYIQTQAENLMNEFPTATEWTIFWDEPAPTPAQMIEMGISLEEYQQQVSDEPVGVTVSREDFTAELIRGLEAGKEPLKFGNDQMAYRESPTHIDKVDANNKAWMLLPDSQAPLEEPVYSPESYDAQGNLLPKGHPDRVLISGDEDYTFMLSAWAKEHMPQKYAEEKRKHYGTQDWHGTTGDRSMWLEFNAETGKYGYSEAAILLLKKDGLLVSPMEWQEQYDALPADSDQRVIQEAEEYADFVRYQLMQQEFPEQWEAIQGTPYVQRVVNKYTTSETGEVSVPVPQTVGWSLLGTAYADDGTGGDTITITPPKQTEIDFWRESPLGQFLMAPLEYTLGMGWMKSGVEHSDFGKELVMGGVLQPMLSDLDFQNRDWLGRPTVVRQGQLGQTIGVGSPTLVEGLRGAGFGGQPIYKYPKDDPLMELKGALGDQLSTFVHIGRVISLAKAIDTDKLWADRDNVMGTDDEGRPTGWFNIERTYGDTDPDRVKLRMAYYGTTDPAVVGGIPAYNIYEPTTVEDIMAGAMETGIMHDIDKQQGLMAALGIKNWRTNPETGEWEYYEGEKTEYEEGEHEARPWITYDPQDPTQWSGIKENINKFNEKGEYPDEWNLGFEYMRQDTERAKEMAHWYGSPILKNQGTLNRWTQAFKADPSKMLNELPSEILLAWLPTKWVKPLMLTAAVKSGGVLQRATSKMLTQSIDTIAMSRFGKTADDLSSAVWRTTKASDRDAVTALLFKTSKGVQTKYQDLDKPMQQRVLETMNLAKETPKTADELANLERMSDTAKGAEAFAHELRVIKMQKYKSEQMYAFHTAQQQAPSVSARLFGMPKGIPIGSVVAGKAGTETSIGGKEIAKKAGKIVDDEVTPEDPIRFQGTQYEYGQQFLSMPKPLFPPAVSGALRRVAESDTLIDPVKLATKLKESWFFRDRSYSSSSLIYRSRLAEQMHLAYGRLPPPLRKIVQSPVSAMQKWNQQKRLEQTMDKHFRSVDDLEGTPYAKEWKEKKTLDGLSPDDEGFQFARSPEEQAYRLKRFGFASLDDWVKIRGTAKINFKTSQAMARIPLGQPKPRWFKGTQSEWIRKSKNLETLPYTSDREFALSYGGKEFTGYVDDVGRIADKDIGLLTVSRGDVTSKMFTHEMLGRHAFGDDIGTFVPLVGKGAMGKGARIFDDTPVMPADWITPTPPSPMFFAGAFSPKYSVLKKQFPFGGQALPKQAPSPKLEALNRQAISLDKQLDAATFGKKGGLSEPSGSVWAKLDDALNANTSADLIQFAEKYATKSELAKLQGIKQTIKPADEAIDVTKQVDEVWGTDKWSPEELVWREANIVKEGITKFRNVGELKDRIAQLDDIIKEPASRFEPAASTAARKALQTSELAVLKATLKNMEPKATATHIQDFKNFKFEKVAEWGANAPSSVAKGIPYTQKLNRGEKILDILTKRQKVKDDIDEFAKHEARLADEDGGLFQAEEIQDVAITSARKMAEGQRGIKKDLMQDVFIDLARGFDMLEGIKMTATATAKTTAKTTYNVFPPAAGKIILSGFVKSATSTASPKEVLKKILMKDRGAFGGYQYVVDEGAFRGIGIGTYGKFLTHNNPLEAKFTSAVMKNAEIIQKHLRDPTGEGYSLVQAGRAGEPVPELTTVGVGSFKRMMEDYEKVFKNLEQQTGSGWQYKIGSKRLRETENNIINIKKAISKLKNDATDLDSAHPSYATDKQDLDIAVGRLMKDLKKEEVLQKTFRESEADSVFVPVISLRKYQVEVGAMPHARYGYKLSPEEMVERRLVQSSIGSSWDGTLHIASGSKYAQFARGMEWESQIESEVAKRLGFGGKPLGYTPVRREIVDKYEAMQMEYYKLQGDLHKINSRMFSSVPMGSAKGLEKMEIENKMRILEKENLTFVGKKEVVFDEGIDVLAEQVRYGTAGRGIAYTIKSSAFKVPTARRQPEREAGYFGEEIDDVGTVFQPLNVYKQKNIMGLSDDYVKDIMPHLLKTDEGFVKSMKEFDTATASSKTGLGAKHWDTVEKEIDLGKGVHTPDSLADAYQMHPEEWFGDLTLFEQKTGSRWKKPMMMVQVTKFKPSSQSGLDFGVHEYHFASPHELWEQHGKHIANEFRISAKTADATLEGERRHIIIDVDETRAIWKKQKEAGQTMEVEILGVKEDVGRTLVLEDLGREMSPQDRAVYLMLWKYEVKMAEKKRVGNWTEEDELNQQAYLAYAKGGHTYQGMKDMGMDFDERVFFDSLGFTQTSKSKHSTLLKLDADILKKKDDIRFLEKEQPAVVKGKLNDMDKEIEDLQNQYLNFALDNYNQGKNLSVNTVNIMKTAKWESDKIRKKGDYETANDIMNKAQTRYDKAVASEHREIYDELLKATNDRDKYYFTSHTTDKVAELRKARTELDEMKEQSVIFYDEFHRAKWYKEVLSAVGGRARGGHEPEGTFATMSLYHKYMNNMPIQAEEIRTAIRIAQQKGYRTPDGLGISTNPNEGWAQVQKQFAENNMEFSIGDVVHRLDYTLAQEEFITTSIASGKWVRGMSFLPKKHTLVYDDTLYLPKSMKKLGYEVNESQQAIREMKKEEIIEIGVRYYEPEDGAEILSQLVQPEVKGMSNLHGDLLKVVRGYRASWNRWNEGDSIYTQGKWVKDPIHGGKKWEATSPKDREELLFDPVTGDQILGRRVGKSGIVKEKEYVEAEYKPTKDEMVQDEYGLYNPDKEGVINKFDDQDADVQAHIMQEWHGQYPDGRPKEGHTPLRGTHTDMDMQWARQHKQESQWERWTVSKYVDGKYVDVEMVGYLKQVKTPYKVKQPEVMHLLLDKDTAHMYGVFKTRRRMISAKEQLVPEKEISDQYIAGGAVTKELHEDLDAARNVLAESMDEVVLATNMAKLQHGNKFDTVNANQGWVQNLIATHFRRNTKDSNDLMKARSGKDRADRDIQILDSERSVLNDDVERLAEEMHQMKTPVSYVDELPSGAYKDVTAKNIKVEYVAPREFEFEYSRILGDQGSTLNPAGVAKKRLTGSFDGDFRKITKRTDEHSGNVQDGTYKPYTEVEQKIPDPNWAKWNKLDAQLKEKQKLLRENQVKLEARQQQRNKFEQDIGTYMARPKVSSDPSRFIDEQNELLAKLTKKEVRDIYSRTRRRLDSSGKEVDEYVEISEAEWKGLSSTEKRKYTKEERVIETSIGGAERVKIEAEYMKLLELHNIKLFFELGKLVKKAKKGSTSSSVFGVMDDVEAPIFSGMDKYGFIEAAYQIARDARQVGKSRAPFSADDFVKMRKGDWLEAVTKLFPEPEDKAALVGIQLSNLNSLKGKVRIQDALVDVAEKEITGLKDELKVLGRVQPKQGVISGSDIFQRRWALNNRIEKKEQWLNTLTQKRDGWRKEIMELEKDVKDVSGSLPKPLTDWDDAKWTWRHETAVTKAKRDKDTVSSLESAIEKHKEKQSYLRNELEVFSDSEFGQIKLGVDSDYDIRPVQGLTGGHGDVSFVYSTRIETPEAYLGTAWSKNQKWMSGEVDKLPQVRAGRQQGTRHVFYVSTGDIPAFNRLPEASFLGKLFEKVFQSPIKEIAPTGFGYMRGGKWISNKTSKYRTEMKELIDESTGKVLLDEEGKPRTELIITGERKPKVDTAGQVMRNKKGEVQYEFIPTEHRSVGKYEMDMDYIAGKQHFPDSEELYLITRRLKAKRVKQSFFGAPWQEIKRGVTPYLVRKKILKHRPKTAKEKGKIDEEEYGYTLVEAGQKNISRQHIEELQRELATEWGVQSVNLGHYTDEIIYHLKQLEPTWGKDDILRYRTHLDTGLDLANKGTLRQRIGARLKARKEFQDAVVFSEKAKQALSVLRYKMDPDVYRTGGRGEGISGTSSENFKELFKMQQDLLHKQNTVARLETQVNKADQTLLHVKSTDMEMKSIPLVDMERTIVRGGVEEPNFNYGKPILTTKPATDLIKHRGKDMEVTDPNLVGGRTPEAARMNELMQEDLMRAFGFEDDIGYQFRLLDKDGSPLKVGHIIKDGDFYRQVLYKKGHKPQFGYAGKIDYEPRMERKLVNRIATEDDVKSGKIVGWDTADESYKQNITKAFEARREAKQDLEIRRKDLENYEKKMKEKETAVNDQRLLHSTQMDEMVIKLFRDADGTREAKARFMARYARDNKFKDADAKFWDELGEAIEKADPEDVTAGRLQTIMAKEKIEVPDELKSQHMAEQMKQERIRRKMQGDYLELHGHVPPNYMGYFMGITKYPNIPPWQRSIQGWQDGKEQEQWWLPQAGGEEAHFGDPSVPAPHEGDKPVTTPQPIAEETAAGLDLSIIPKELQESMMKQYDLTLPAVRTDLMTRPLLGHVSIQDQGQYLRELQKLQQRMRTMQTTIHPPALRESFEPVLRPIRRAPWALFPPLFPMFPDYRRRPRRSRMVKRPKRKIWWDVPEQPLGEPWAATEYKVFGQAGVAGETEYVQRKEAKKKLDGTPFGIKIDQDVNFWTQHEQDRGGFTMRRQEVKDQYGRSVKDEKGKKVRHKGQKAPWKRKRFLEFPDS